MEFARINTRLCVVYLSRFTGVDIEKGLFLSVPLALL